MARRDPSSSGLQARLSRTRRTGPELPGYPLVGADWERGEAKGAKLASGRCQERLSDSPDQRNDFKNKEVKPAGGR